MRGREIAHQPQKADRPLAGKTRADFLRRTRQIPSDTTTIERLDYRGMRGGTKSRQLERHSSMSARQERERDRHSDTD